MQILKGFACKLLSPWRGQLSTSRIYLRENWSHWPENCHIHLEHKGKYFCKWQRKFITLLTSYSPLKKLPWFESLTFQNKYYSLINKLKIQTNHKTLWKKKTIKIISLHINNIYWSNYKRTSTSIILPYRTSIILCTFFILNYSHETKLLSIPLKRPLLFKCTMVTFQSISTKSIFGYADWH